MWVVVALLALAVVSANADLAQPTSGPESRIIAGWDAQDGQFPYIIYLRGVNQFGDLNACGGSIIHNSWGLTSARCIASRLSLHIRAGSVNVNTPRVIIESSTYFTHPNYLDNLWQITQPDDVGLVFFSTPLVFSNFIQPIRLAPSVDKDRDYSGVVMYTGGWGTTTHCDPLTDSSCKMSERLKWAELVGMNNFMCLLVFNSNYLVRSSTICARPYNEPGQSICAGDAGVPLTAVDTDGNLSQVGIASFVSGFGCTIGLPGGFVRPHYYHDWIRAQTGIQFDWSK